MSCLPSASKCEWRDLKHFVDHLNCTESVDFTRTTCLDLCGNSNSKQPEVLCTASNNVTLVIERKSIVWPENYAAKHKAEHRFFQLLIDKLSPLLDANAPYELRLSPLNSTSDKILAQQSDEIKNFVDQRVTKLNAGETLTSQQPLAFSIRKQKSSERDSDDPESGICISMHEAEIKLTDGDGQIESKFIDLLSRLLASAPEKFSNYKQSRRMVLLQPISVGLFESICSHECRLLGEISIPRCIQEIWLAFEYAPAHWEYTQIHPTSALQAQV
jgi:hypothetical protein